MTKHRQHKQSKTVLKGLSYIALEGYTLAIDSLTYRDTAKELPDKHYGFRCSLKS